MTKKIIIKYRGELCTLNAKDAPGATGKKMAIRPKSCKDCRPFKYTTEEYKNAKMEIQWKVKNQIDVQVQKIGSIFSSSDGPLFIDMIVYYKNRADVDAFNKIILDALTGMAYTDDSLIKKQTVEIMEKQAESGFDAVITQINPGLF